VDIGAIAQATERLRLGTGVTCPLIRTHPAVIAHASATASVLMPGRFFLGLGTGENLNEHVLGDRWPEGKVRFEMLTEAIEVIRLLWQGGYQSHHGQYYTIEQARPSPTDSWRTQSRRRFATTGASRQALVAVRVRLLGD
jgi:coenzyme F420-dependent glucose-6-phosphate dehydrogenase